LNNIVISPTFKLILQVILSIGLIFIIPMWFFRGNQGTPGAGDNLISSCIAYQIGYKFISQQEYANSLNHTRLILASWDGEEAGLRGARAYCKKHKKELQSIPTKVINLDCIYNLKEMFLLTTDVNGTIQLSKNLAQKLSNVAKSLGYNLPIKPIAFLTGGTDAGEFGRINVPTTSLIAMKWSNSVHNPVYHTPNDTLDKIDPKIVQVILNILLEFILHEDKSII
jgi:Zn-dependent M28 family amino/carboxypeptidase